MSKAQDATPDVGVADYGSLVLVHPCTPEAREWIRRNVPSENWQWIGGHLAVEPRYADNLLSGMADDGLTIA